jgi:hypothetical protein
MLHGNAGAMSQRDGSFCELIHGKPDQLVHGALSSKGELLAMFITKVYLKGFLRTHMTHDT